ncbi:MAG TPA: alkaline phosphatase family protein [Gaiellaceae bacterium]|nr:alkaline phosphatase family protein [Gaiellaceae bacterium]
MTRLLALLLVTAAAGAAPVPSLDHVVVIVFENKEQQQVIGSPSAPTFTALARRYARFTNYRAVTHPSLPNYIAMVSGDTQGIRSNCTSCIVDARNLADTVEASGRTWKAYAEGLPHPGFTGAVSGRYAKKHMPFLYFRDIVSSTARRANVVPLTRLRRDLQAGALPNFSLIVPDMCNSMHDCSIRTGDRWLARTIPPLLRLPNTVVFVTFDEGSARNNVPTLALGTAVRPTTRVATPTGHYGLLRTIEEAWGLPLLGRSASAKPLTTIWRDSGSRME